MGTALKVLVYIGVNHDFGTHTCFAYHGAKYGGGADKQVTAGMYEGFKFWHQALDDAARDFIQDRACYNVAHGVEAFKEGASAAEKVEFASTPFHPKYFMVRISSPCIACPN